MIDDLKDLLLALIPCHTGHQHGYFQKAAASLRIVFKADALALFVGSGHGANWNLLAAEPESAHQRFAVAPAAPPGRQPWRMLDERDHDEMLMDLQVEQGPDFLCRVDWTTSTPPAWVTATDLTSFREKLGLLLSSHYVAGRIQQSKNHLQYLFDQLPVGIFSVGPGFTLERVNRALTQLLDLGYDQVVNKKCFDIICLEKKPPAQCPLRSVRDPGCYSGIVRSHNRDLKITHFTSCGAGQVPRLIGFLHTAQASSLRHPQLVDPDHAFSQLYDRLSQPLTALHLLSDFLQATGKDLVCEHHLSLLRHELGRVVTILRQEKRTADRSSHPPPGARLTDFILSDQDEVRERRTTPHG